MNTRRIAAEYRLSHWADIMRDRQESGLSIKAYCEQAGFHENSYFYWQRKLRTAAYEQLTETENSSQPTSLTASRFTEIKLCTPSEQLLLPEIAGPVPETVALSEICIEIASLRITANAAYPTSQLSELIKGVMAP